MKKLVLSFSIVMLTVAGQAQTTQPKNKPATNATKPTVTKPVTTVSNPPVKKEEIKPPKGDAKPGEYYGEKVKIDRDAPEIKRIVSDTLLGIIYPGGHFYAKITEVCPTDGCWVKLELNDGKAAVVMMKDTAVFLPLAAKGRKVRIDGMVEIKELSVVDQKKNAVHINKSKEEIDAITKPIKQVYVLANGILVVE